ncbi:MAG TPA: MATE family efflux transporter [Herpetosiphonaceae bacterium]
MRLDELATKEQAEGNVPIRPQQSLRRRVLGLAAPVIGENLLQTLLGVVDTILVAGLGAAALAGVGSALQIIFVLIAALSALSVGASVLVAQAYGAGDLAAASRYAQQSLLWSVIVSIPLALLGFVLSGPIVGLLGVEPDVARIAVQYLHVTIGTIVTIMVLLIGGGVLRGAGDSRTPMLITAFANILNVALAYALIYGHVGLPALGAVGSAWATFLSRLVGAVILVWVLLRGRNGVRVGRGLSWRPQYGVARDVLRIGLPAALEEVLVITAFATLTPIVAGLGTVALAAHRVIINVLSLSFLPGIGFGLAATALVGQSIGARRPEDARAITSIALRWAMIWMGVLGVIFVLFAPQLMRLFTNDQAMVAMGAAGIRVVALAQPFWAGTFVFAGALRGTGNTRLPLFITSVAVWSVVGLGYLAIELIQPSLLALWAAFLVVGPFEVGCFWLAWRWWRRL